MLLGMAVVEEKEVEGCNLWVCLDSRGTRNPTARREPDMTQGR
jgi:hypothetical protein